MRSLKILIGALGAPLLVLAGLGLFLPSQWYAERALMIDVPLAAVHPFLGDLRRWPELGLWALGDPESAATFNASGTEVSFKDSRLKILSADPLKGVEFMLD